MFTLLAMSPVAVPPGSRWPEKAAHGHAGQADGQHDHAAPTSATIRPQRRRRLRRQGGGGARSMARSTDGGAGGVAVAQRLVVVLVDVAGGPLALEVVERAQQEVALLLQLGRARRGRPSRLDSSAPHARLRPRGRGPRRWARRRRRCRATGGTPAPARRRRARAPPPAGSTPGCRCPVVAGTSSRPWSAKRSLMYARISSSVWPGRHLAGDLVADVLRRRRPRLVHALAAARRALERLGDGVDALLGRAGRRSCGWRRTRGRPPPRRPSRTSPTWPALEPVARPPSRARLQPVEHAGRGCRPVTSRMRAEHHRRRSGRRSTSRAPWPRRTSR